MRQHIFSNYCEHIQNMRKKSNEFSKRVEGNLGYERAFPAWPKRDFLEAKEKKQNLGQIN